LIEALSLIEFRIYFE